MVNTLSDDDKMQDVGVEEMFDIASLRLAPDIANKKEPNPF